MHRFAVLTVVAALATSFSCASASAQEKETAKLEEAIQVLVDIEDIPEKAIPPALLNNAAAVAVIPHVVKAGFVVGGRYGWGVLAVRQGGGWSPPAFVSIMGGSFGWQIGVQATDVVLVFKNRESVEMLSKGKFTLGADASVAAGPVGRSASAATDVQLRAAIYSYSRSKGLFAGVALEGAALQIDRRANTDFYGREGLTLGEIFKGQVPTPAVAAEFDRTLAKYSKETK